MPSPAVFDPWKEPAAETNSMKHFAVPLGWNHQSRKWQLLPHAQLKNILTVAPPAKGGRWKFSGLRMLALSAVPPSPRQHGTLWSQSPEVESPLPPVPVYTRKPKFVMRVVPSPQPGEESKEDNDSLWTPDMEVDEAQKVLDAILMEVEQERSQGKKKKKYEEDSDDTMDGGDAWTPVQSKTMPLKPGIRSRAAARAHAKSRAMMAKTGKAVLVRDRPHKCKLCGMRFIRPDHLHQHMRSHTGEKPYKCPIRGCGKRFSYAGDVNRHKRRLHYERGEFDEETPSPSVQKHHKRRGNKRRKK